MLNNSTAVNSSSTITTILLLLGKLLKTSYLTRNRLTTSISRGNELEKAEEFNEYFVEVGKRTFEKTQTNLNDMNLNHDNTHENENYENLFRPEPVDVNTVILTIKHLKTPTPLALTALHFAISMIHCLLSLTT